MQYRQQKIQGAWYLFDQVTGAMKYGPQWIPAEHKTVYYGSDGRMRYGFQDISGETYYFDRISGARKTGK